MTFVGGPTEERDGLSLQRPRGPEYFHGNLNGNGPPEIALLLDYGSPKGIEAEIRDSLTGAFIKNISVP